MESKEAQNSKERQHFKLSAFGVGVFFCLATSMVTRNLYRMNQQLKQYQRLLGLVQQTPRSLPDPKDRNSHNIKTQSVLLNIHVPNLAAVISKSIQLGNFTTNMCRFYHEVQCDPPTTQAIYRLRGKDYPILLSLPRPHIGQELAKHATQLHQSKQKIHSQQLVAILGQLSVRNKNIVLQGQMAGIDHVEMVKYWQSRLLAVGLSGFYWGVVLGVSLAVGIIEQVNIDRIIEGFTTQNQVNGQQKVDERPTDTDEESK